MTTRKEGASNVRKFGIGKRYKESEILENFTERHKMDIINTSYECIMNTSYEYIIWAVNVTGKDQIMKQKQSN